MRTDSDDCFLSYNSYRWPVRSVERVPPFNPTALKTPVLVIGNSVRTFPYPGIKPSHNLTTAIPRLTRSRRSRVRKRSPACSARTLSCLSSSDSVIRLSLRSRLALGPSWPITWQTPRSVLFSAGCAFALICFPIFSFHRATPLSVQSTNPISSLP